jgi:SAM-dependent methyltransferase
VTASLDKSYFDAIYAAESDPWRFASSAYERDKYAATLAALEGRRYARALEVGCSIGVLTRRLADVCESLVAIDISDRPLAEARRRSADAPWVRFERMAAPREWPEGSFDLILLSEVIYYLDREDVGALANRVRESLASGGNLVLVHWTGETDYPLTGDEAATLLMKEASPFLSDPRQQRFDRFRLDIATRLCAREPEQGARW